MLQVVTFNIGGARGMRPAPHDHHRLAADAFRTLQQVINPAQPTLIALQETGRARTESGEKDAGRRLAQLLGSDYRTAFAAEVTMRAHPHPKLWDRPAYRQMRAAAEGNAIITNLPAAEWAWGTYPPGSRWARHTPISRATLYSSGSRDTQPRNLMAASLHYRASTLYFLNTHLGVLTSEDRHDPSTEGSRSASQMRQAQVSEILRVIAELKAADLRSGKPERPILLAGDFNAQPGTPEMALLQRDFRLLQPENRPSERWTHQRHRILIDHILLHDPAANFEVLSCHIQSRIPFDDLSDHRPAIGILKPA